MPSIFVFLWDYLKSSVIRFFMFLFVFLFFLLSFLLFFFFDFSCFFLSESDELELDDVSDSEMLLDDELDIKELDHDNELQYFCFRDFLVLDLLLP